MRTSLAPRHVYRRSHFKYSTSSSQLDNICLFLSATMRASFLLPTLLACSAVATDAINAFKRVDRVLESRSVEKQKGPTPRHERLEKRSSPYLTNTTQSMYRVIIGLSMSNNCRIRCRWHQDSARRCRFRPDALVTRQDIDQSTQFDIGESYAGLLPISSKSNETRELFFW